MSVLDSKQQRFVDQAIRRERLFLILSGVSVVVGLSAMGLAVWRGASGVQAGPTFVIAILILLNGRQNLRQHKYARALRTLGAGSVELEACDDGQVV